MWMTASLQNTLSDTTLENLLAQVFEYMTIKNPVPVPPLPDDQAKVVMNTFTNTHYSKVLYDQLSLHSSI